MSFDTLICTWLASGLQQSLTWSKLSPPGCRQLTRITCTLGHRSCCQGGSNAEMVVEAEWKSGVHHLLLKCSVYIKVRLMLWAWSCLLPYALKHYCTVLPVCHLREEHRLGMSGVVVLDKLFCPRGRKQQEAEEECIMRSWVVFTAGQTLLGWPNEEEWAGRGMKHARREGRCAYKVLVGKSEG